MNSRADVNSDNRLIFGNLFDGNAMPIREIKGETGPIIIEGEVFSYEKEDIKNGKAIVLIALPIVPQRAKYIEFKNSHYFERSL